MVDADSGDPEEFDQADERDADHNVVNAQHRILPGNERDAPAMVINPDAYAFLRKQVKFLRDGEWHGYHLPANDVHALLDQMELTSDGLSESGKTSAAELANAIWDNRTPDGGTILVREGLHPISHALALAEERMHAFQDKYWVKNGWLRKNEKVAQLAARAKEELARRRYQPDEYADEISSKLMAGDRMGLSVDDAEELRGSYLDALKEKWGDEIIDKLPTLVDRKERFDGPQP